MAQNEYLVQTEKSGNLTVKTDDHHDNPTWSSKIATSLHKFAENQNMKDAKDVLGLIGSINGIHTLGSKGWEALSPKKANEVESLLKQILERMPR